MTAPELGAAALVLVDLQTRIVGLPTAPRAGAEVAATALTLAGAFRAAGRPVVVIRVHRPGLAEQPAGSELVAGLPGPGDVVVTKHTIGGFHGTELDAVLRERGADTLVLAGIATNLGVESTARAASDHGYALVFVEDAMAALTEPEHELAVRHTFPRFGTVATAAEVRAALQPDG